MSARLPRFYVRGKIQRAIWRAVVDGPPPPWTMPRSDFDAVLRAAIVLEDRFRADSRILEAELASGMIRVRRVLRGSFKLHLDLDADRASLRCVPPWPAWCGRGSP